MFAVLLGLGLLCCVLIAAYVISPVWNDPFANEPDGATDRLKRAAGSARPGHSNEPPACARASNTFERPPQ